MAVLTEELGNSLRLFAQDYYKVSFLLFLDSKDEKLIIKH